MKRWQSAPCHVLLLLVLTDAVADTTTPAPSYFGLETSEGTQKSTLANVTHIGGRWRKDLKADTANGSNVTAKSLIATSTLRRMIIPAYARLHAAGKLSPDSRKPKPGASSVQFKKHNTTTETSTQAYGSKKVLSSVMMDNSSTTDVPSYESTERQMVSAYGNNLMI